MAAEDPALGPIPGRVTGPALANYSGRRASGSVPASHRFGSIPNSKPGAGAAPAAAATVRVGGAQPGDSKPERTEFESV